MRAPPARAAAPPCPPVRPGAAARRAGNSLALPRPPDIACGQRGKGGGPTACIAVGLARWLSASRRPAGVPAEASAKAVRSLAVAGPPSGCGWRAARRRPANTRQTPSPRVGRPCPAGPRVASLASRGARRCARPRGGHAPPRMRGARPYGRRPGVFISPEVCVSRVSVPGRSPFPFHGHPPPPHGIFLRAPGHLPRSRASSALPGIFHAPGHLPPLPARAACDR
jgi:hypothetical protein